MAKESLLLCWKERPINILFISPNSPLESVGGVERYLTNVIEYSKNQSQFNAFVLLPTSKDNHTTDDGGVVMYFDQNINMAKYDSSKVVGAKAQKFAEAVEKILKMGS